MRVYDDDGAPLAANFQVEIVDGSISLIFESGGGTTKSGVARNADYADGLEVLLRRLAQLGATITDAYVDSSRMQKQPLDARRLDIPGWPYDIKLNTVTDFDTFRKKLTAAQEPIGQDEGTKGGNRTKRVRIQLLVPGFLPDAASVAKLRLILSESQGSPEGPAPASHSAAKSKKSRTSGGGQGFILDVATKLAIEAAGMAAAERYYEERGWTVTDVSLQKVGYDLLCERGDERRYVEVKGTTQAPKSVLLSPREVSFSLAHPDESDLFVLSGIVITMEGDVTAAHGGDNNPFEPWNLDPERLTPSGYSYALDGLG